MNTNIRQYRFGTHIQPRTFSSSTSRLPTSRASTPPALRIADRCGVVETEQHQLQNNTAYQHRAEGVHGGIPLALRVLRICRYENGAWLVVPQQMLRREIAALFQTARAPFSAAEINSILDT